MRGAAIRDSAGVSNGLLQALNRVLEIWPRTEYGLMLHQPYRFKGGRVAGQPGNDMPVDMGELVAEKFVIDLLGFIDLSKSFGDEIYFLHQLNPFRGSQMKQLCRVAFEHDDDPTGKELIVVKIGFRQSEVGDEMVGSGPGA